MKRILIVVLTCGFCVITMGDLSAQRLKDLGLKKAKDKLKSKIEEKTNIKTDDSSDDKSENSSKTLNKRLSPTEVSATLDAALTSFNNKDYSDARFSIQEALVEIEHQLGEEVLAEMPKTAMGQPYDPDQDIAVSTGVGFIGLEISRTYPDAEGDIHAIIANNSAMIGIYSMAFSNPQYVAQNENMKSVTVDGKRGILELSGDTYKLAIPFGQSSIFMLQCASCANESDVTSLAGDYDLDKYLSILGEGAIQVDQN